MGIEKVLNYQSSWVFSNYSHLMTFLTFSGIKNVGPSGHEPCGWERRGCSGISYSTFAHSCQTWGEITCMIAWLSINIFYTLLLCCPRNKWYAFPQCIKGLLLIWAILINHYISQIHVHFPNLEITCHILLLLTYLEIVASDQLLLPNLCHTQLFVHSYSMHWSLVIVLYPLY